MPVKASIAWTNVCFEKPQVFPLVTEHFIIGNYPGKQFPFKIEMRLFFAKQKS